MDLIDRLHARLLQALEQEPDGATAARITIGDVYQRLVPYRAVRGEMGILELAEYEDALLRLLAGERGYVQVEDDDARLELQRELASTNPILGIYRDYAAAPVRALGRRPGPATSSPAPEPISRPSPPVPDVTEEAPPPVPGADAMAPPAPARCRRCGESLPDEADLRFCPACGEDQREVPCAQCGGRLRTDWNFCIRCGTPRPGAAARA